MIVALLVAIEMMVIGIPGQAKADMVAGPVWNPWETYVLNSQPNAGGGTDYTLVSGIFGPTDLTLPAYDSLTIEALGNVYVQGTVTFDPSSRNILQVIPGRFPPRPGPGEDVSGILMSQWMDEAPLAATGSIYFNGLTTVSPMGAFEEGRSIILAASYSPYTIAWNAPDFTLPANWTLTSVYHYQSSWRPCWDGDDGCVFIDGLWLYQEWTPDGQLLFATYNSNPVPLPSSILLLSSGLLGLVGTRIRKHLQDR